MVEPGQYLEIDPPFTINFHIDRTSNASASTMDLKIYGLSASTRSLIFQDSFAAFQESTSYKSIVLQAGYDNLPSIFEGNIQWAYSSRETPNVVTEIHAFDGGWDLINSRSKCTIGGNQSQKDIINILMNNYKYVKKGEVGDYNKENKTPLMIDGNTFRLLRNIGGPTSFVDLQTHHVLNLNEVIDGFVYLFTSDSGLLGTPKRQDKLIMIDIMFEPNVVVGQVIEVYSSIQPEFNGQYKVLGIQHTATISEAICGDAKTKLFLLPPQTVYQSNSQTSQQFNLVKNGVVTPFSQAGSAPITSVTDAYNYILKFSKAPHTRITKGFYWDDMITPPNLATQTPTIIQMNNIAKVCTQVQALTDKYFPGSSFVVQSGWRSIAHNQAVGGANSSLHLQGLAMDTWIGSYSAQTIYSTLNPIWSGGLEIDSSRSVHIDIGSYRRF